MILNKTLHLILDAQLVSTLGSGLHMFVLYLGLGVALFTIKPNDLHAGRFKKFYKCHNSFAEKSFVA